MKVSSSIDYVNQLVKLLDKEGIEKSWKFYESLIEKDGTNIDLWLSYTNWSKENDFIENDKPEIS